MRNDGSVCGVRDFYRDSRYLYGVVFTAEVGRMQIEERLHRMHKSIDLSCCLMCNGTKCDGCVAQALLNDIDAAIEECRWHPYPHEKPRNVGRYLVALEEGGVSTAFWKAEEEVWSFFNGMVLAWMPLPEPYKEEQQ